MSLMSGNYFLVRRSSENTAFPPQLNSRSMQTKLTLSNISFGEAWTSILGNIR